MPVFSLRVSVSAPVVQWIEHWSPELVSYPLGSFYLREMVLPKTKIFAIILKNGEN